MLPTCLAAAQLQGQTALQVVLGEPIGCQELNSGLQVSFPLYCHFRPGLFCFVDHIQQRSGFIPGFVFVNYSWWGSGDRMWCRGSNMS